jgi:hypothetical protein
VIKTVAGSPKGKAVSQHHAEAQTFSFYDGRRSQISQADEAPPLGVAPRDRLAAGFTGRRACPQRLRHAFGVGTLCKQGYRSTSSNACSVTPR